MAARRAEQPLASSASRRSRRRRSRATNAVAGRVVELARRGELLDPALVEHRDAIGHRQRLALVVRHVDERDAEPALQGLELDLHFFAQLQVERTQRLIEQQHLGLIDQRTRQRDALPLAARKLRRASLALRCRAAPAPASPRALALALGLGTPRTRRP